MSNNNEEQNIQIKIKERKVYLTDNKNDMYKKNSVEYVKEQIIKSTLFAYNREKPKEKEKEQEQKDGTKAWREGGRRRVRDD